MADSYPYILNNGKIGSLLSAIESAAKPPKFTYEFLGKIGFPSSNDRAFVTLFRHLGLIDENNVPTEIYDEVRDPASRPFALGRAIKRSYADLFAINTNLNRASDAEIKSAISRVTGKDADYVGRAFNTFKSLLNQAKFDGKPAIQEKAPPEDQAITPNRELNESNIIRKQAEVGSGMSLNYNIQIHLPATTDISVYNAIFRSLRDTLGVS